MFSSPAPDRTDTADDLASDPVGVLADDDDVQPLREWLRAVGVAVDAVANLPQWNVDAPSSADARPPTYPDLLAQLQPRVRTTLQTAFEAAAAERFGVARLMVYVHFSCDQTWEVSYHFDPMWATLAAVRPLWNEMAEQCDVQERMAAEAVLHLIDNLYAEIECENAMNAGRLRECARLHGLAARHAVAAKDRASEVLVGVPDPGAECIARYVREWARVTAVTDAVAELAADAVTRFLHDARFGLDPTIDALLAAETELFTIYNSDDEAADATGEPDEPDDLEADPPVDSDALRKLLGSEDWSELRAHRFSLQALRDIRSEPEREWLYVDEARIVYLYPFALKGLRVDDEFQRTASAAAGGWSLAGVTPQDVYPSFMLDDVWDSTDPAGRRFDGIRIKLPEVELSERHGAPVAGLDAEIRLSRLGNHYLRFEGELHDRDPQQVFAALGRAAPEHGSLAVGFVDDNGAFDNGGNDSVAYTAASPAGTTAAPDAPWPRLCALAVDIVHDLSTVLRTPATVRPGMFQVLLTVSSGSLRRGPDPAALRREVRSLDDVKAAFGAGVLFNPVSHVMSSLAEWSRYPVRADVEVVGVTNLSDHITLRTPNTTVHLGWGLPLWTLSTASTVSEFAASLDGLFAGWLEELDEYRRQVGARRALEGPDEDLEKLRERVNSLRELRSNLLDQVTEMRSMIGLINSPSLTRSPTVAVGLATMVAASGFEQRVRQVNGQIDEILSDRLEADIDRLLRRCEDIEREQEEQRKDLQEVQERRQRRRLDTLLAVIAAVGVSGLGQILQSGYGVGAFGSLEITGAIVFLAFVVGLWAWYTSRHPIGTTRSQPREPRDPAQAPARGKGQRVPRQRRHGTDA